MTTPTTELPLTLIKRVRKVGFVGSLQGMTLPQLQGVAQILSQWSPKVRWVNHCDYIGACAQLHALIRETYPLISIQIYPTRDTAEKYRAHCAADRYSEASSHGDEDYRLRNRRFVFESSVLLIAPAEDRLVILPDDLMRRRQVVWDIVWYAAQIVKRTMVVVWPNGVVEFPYQLAQMGEHNRPLVYSGLKHHRKEIEHV